MHYPWLLAILALRCSLSGGAGSVNGDSQKSGEVVSIEFFVDDAAVTFPVLPGHDPYFSAALFCSTYGLGFNVEGVNCVGLLGEEAISRGAAFAPWLSAPQPALRLLPGIDASLAVQVAAFCEGWELVATACDNVLSDAVSAGAANLLREATAPCTVDSSRGSPIPSTCLLPPHPIYLPLRTRLHSNNSTPPSLPEGGHSGLPFVAAEIPLGDGVMAYNITLAGAPYWVHWRSAAEKLCLWRHPDPTRCNVDAVEVGLRQAALSASSLDAPDSPGLLPLVAFVDVSVGGSESSSVARAHLFKGQNPWRAASSFCARYRCPDRVNSVAAVGRELGQQLDFWPQEPPQHDRNYRQPFEENSSSSGGDDTDSSGDASVGNEIIPQEVLALRVVVSLSTLPSRLAGLGSRLVNVLNKQTLKPACAYVVVPERSLRLRIPYPDLPPGWPYHQEHDGSDHHEDENGYGGSSSSSTTYHGPIAGYAISSSLHGASRVPVVVLRPEVDWGPASKLIPVLAIETHPATVILTIDDDIFYPPNLVLVLARASLQRPNSAVGFSGYNLIGSPFEHPNFLYVDSVPLPESTEGNHESGVSGGSPESEERPSSPSLRRVGAENSGSDVDVLGGVFGIAYRSAFFDLDALTDYAPLVPSPTFEAAFSAQADATPEGVENTKPADIKVAHRWKAFETGPAFFVDDDWIATRLDLSGISRVVLGASEGGDTARELLLGSVLLAPEQMTSNSSSQGKNSDGGGEEASLNGASHGHRNREYQRQVLTKAAVELGLFRAGVPRQLNKD